MGKSKELAELGDVVTQSNGVVKFSDDTLSVVTASSGSTTLANYAYATGWTYDLSNASEKHTIGTSSAAPTAFKTDNVERMTIDASGRVTMPYQPSFRVVLQTSNGTSSTTTQLVNWGVQHNIGGHFSTSTSRFTAPVSGVYLMNYTGLHSSNGANTGYWVRMYFMINGTAYLDGLGDNGTYGSYQRLSVSAQFYLNAGDYVTTHAQSNQTNSTGVYSGYTHWSGHLIG